MLRAMHCFPRQSHVLLRAAAAAFALWSMSLVAVAQPLPGGAQLGMSADQLQAAVAGVARVVRPLRMAGGLVGSWSEPSVDIAGVPFAATFFFAGDALQRVEYVATANDPKAFDAVRAWCRSQWNQELASQNPEGAYAAWSTDDIDVYLQSTSVRERPVLRLVIKRRVLKDGSEL
jgi:hypothetical protein